MAYAPMPKIVSIHSSKIGCSQSVSTLTEVVQSESVQRLLKRQNVFLQNSAASGFSNNKSPADRRNGLTVEIKTEKKDELSVIPIMSFAENDGSTSDVEEDKHLLPSKHEGKSGVALLPIRYERRACGHCEPCESLVCDVSFQQHRDGDDIEPLIAVNIDADGIDAPVSKHCRSNSCDALSIDHDRCRRAIIRCHRCDETNTCDICLVVPKTRKSKVNHRNCKMRIEYRHNRASRGQILRDRMRQREVEILEAARTNRNDYADPVSGHDRAMESLQNNSELIVIPKAALPVQQHPTIRITSVTGAAITPKSQITGFYGRTLSRPSMVSPSRRVLLGKRTSPKSASHATPAKQTKSDESAGTATTNSGSLPLRSPFITITAMPDNRFIRPLTINDFLQSQSQTNPGSQMQTSPFLMPIRVVPIASLKTGPSLMHHNQGIPKFCLVTDSSSQPTSTSSKSLKRILPAVKTDSSVSNNAQKNDSKVESGMKKFTSGARRGKRKKLVSKRGLKVYQCTFCQKKICTDWYFKLHVAKHKGEIKFTCKFCKKPFKHLYNMTKHIVTMHKKDSAEDSATKEEIDAYIEEDRHSLNCASCNQSFVSKTELENHPCRVVCMLCHARVLHGDLLLHLKAKHVMSNEKAVEEYERQREQRAVAKNGGESRRRLKVEISDVGHQDGDSLTRKRNAIASSDPRKRSSESNAHVLARRPIRRRNNSLINQLESALPNKGERICPPNQIQRHVKPAPISSLSLDAESLTTCTPR